MKLKQRVVVLCAVLLLLGLAKIFLLDGGEGSVASRRDLRAFRKVRVPVSCFHFQRSLKHLLKTSGLSFRRKIKYDAHDGYRLRLVTILNSAYEHLADMYISVL